MNLHLKVINGEMNCSFAKGTEYHDDEHSWDVKIRDNKIYFRAEREYSDGPAVFKKVFPLRDGTYIMAGGNIYDRFVAFRNKEYADWLEKNQIRSFKKSDPNQEYRYWHYGYFDCFGNGTCISVKTDGKIIRNYDTEDHEQRFSIVDASYCLVREWQQGSVRDGAYTTIYSLKDWRELKIPEEWTERRV